MMISRFRVAVLVGLFAAAFGACSLNPQPIPPGFRDEGNPSAAGPSDASSQKHSDGGGVTADDVDSSRRADVDVLGPFLDAGFQAEDGSDASDAGDGAADAATDAGDAATDAPAD